MRRIRRPKPAARRAPNIVLLERIEYVTLASRVYRAIKDRILTGQIPLGGRLRDEDLAAQLGVSRTPVREALMTLTREGLVEMVPRSQTSVRRLTEHDLEEIFDIRIALETLAVRTATERIRPEQLKRLRGAQREGEMALKKGNPKLALDFDHRMHKAILEASGNRRLQEMMVTIDDYVTLFRNISATTRFHRGYTAKHAEILQGLARQDPEGSARALAEHLLVAKEQTLRDFVQRELLQNHQARNELRKAGPVPKTDARSS